MRCKNFRNYKGLYPPMCGGFDGPCEACYAKYKKVQEELRKDGARKVKEIANGSGDYKLILRGSNGRSRKTAV